LFGGAGPSSGTSADQAVTPDFSGRTAAVDFVKFVLAANLSAKQTHDSLSRRRYISRLRGRRFPNSV
jgi:hypothetical protein